MCPGPNPPKYVNVSTRARSLDVVQTEMTLALAAVHFVVAAKPPRAQHTHTVAAGAAIRARQHKHRIKH